MFLNIIFWNILGPHRGPRGPWRLATGANTSVLNESESAESIFGQFVLLGTWHRHLDSNARLKNKFAVQKGLDLDKDKVQTKNHSWVKT